MFWVTNQHRMIALVTLQSLTAVILLSTSVILCMSHPRLKADSTPLFHVILILAVFVPIICVFVSVRLQSLIGQRERQPFVSSLLPKQVALWCSFILAINAAFAYDDTSTTFLSIISILVFVLCCLDALLVVCELSFALEIKECSLWSQYSSSMHRPTPWFHSNNSHHFSSTSNTSISSDTSTTENSKNSSDHSTFSSTLPPLYAHQMMLSMRTERHRRLTDITEENSSDLRSDSSSKFDSCTSAISRTEPPSSV